MSKSQIPIQLVEDDLHLAQSISGLLATQDHACKIYPHAEDYIAHINSNPANLAQTSCLIADVRLPGMSGIDLMHMMHKDHPNCVWPTILITGHGDIAMAVNSLQEGAFAFLTKPFDPYALADKVNQAVLKSEELQKTLAFLSEFDAHSQHLTDQEKIIMERLLHNQTSREIAEALGNSTRTIEVHRAAIFTKMGVTSLMQLAQIKERHDLLSKAEKH